MGSKKKIEWPDRKIRKEIEENLNELEKFVKIKRDKKNRIIRNGENVSVNLLVSPEFHKHETKIRDDLDIAKGRDMDVKNFQTQYVEIMNYVLEDEGIKYSMEMRKLEEELDSRMKEPEREKNIHQRVYTTYPSHRVQYK